MREKGVPGDRRPTNPGHRPVMGRRGAAGRPRLTRSPWSSRPPSPAPTCADDLREAVRPRRRRPRPRRIAVALCLPRRSRSSPTCSPPGASAPRRRCWTTGSPTYEVDQALRRLTPQVVVGAQHATGGPLRGFVESTERVDRLSGPAGRHRARACIQLSSGSTGPSKVIGRTAANLVDEIERYTQDRRVSRRAASGSSRWPRWCTCSAWSAACSTACTPASSWCCRQRMTADGILSTVGAGPRRPPCSASRSTSSCWPPCRTRRSCRSCTGMTTGGELVRGRGPRRVRRPLRRPAGQHVRDDRGRGHRHRPVRRAPPAVAPAPGITVREADGELLVVAARRRRTSG